MKISHSPSNAFIAALHHRPNKGRTFLSKDMVHKMINEKKVWKGGYSVSQAIDIWNKEFSKADRPVSETYQFSCTGMY
jgi:hypothetical protein